jgi:NTP pyrophosphatase (non-canonical NTP hydrolase)
MPQLNEKPTLKDYQNYVYDMEKHFNWLDHDLVTNCFFMGEEMGELFRAVRYVEKMGFDPDKKIENQSVAEELVDVFNYLLAIANRLDIDMEQAFRDKNAKNMQRTWETPKNA